MTIRLTRMITLNIKFFFDKASDRCRPGPEVALGIDRAVAMHDVHRISVYLRFMETIGVTPAAIGHPSMKENIDSAMRDLGKCLLVSPCFRSAQLHCLRAV